MRQTIGFFKWSVAATVAGIVAAYLYGGVTGATVVAVLIALEASISFDNAVVNASVLRRMSENWQRVFLTVGIVIAVFGMRVLFPVLIVAVATGIGLLEVANQALTDKKEYAENVETATPLIGGFGGAFLMMVALGFLLDPDRKEHWLGPIDRALAKAGRAESLPVAVTAIAVIATSQIVGAKDEAIVLLAGIVGIVTNIVVQGVSTVLEQRAGGQDEGGATGATGLALFVYLETLDASFSLDGVLGAFAITKDIVLIAIGLGVGAIYIRSLTVFLVRRESLSRYSYLKHGAHWAILGLAVILFASVKAHVPEWLAATVGLGTIVAAFVSSIVRNRREEGSGG